MTARSQTRGSYRADITQTENADRFHSVFHPSCCLRFRADASQRQRRNANSLRVPQNKKKGQATALWVPSRFLPKMRRNVLFLTDSRIRLPGPYLNSVVPFFSHMNVCQQCEGNFHVSWGEFEGKKKPVSHRSD